MNATDIKPGKLVRLRHREWVVLPSNDEDLLRVKPLGGSEDEITSIYLPFRFRNEQVEEVYFPKPNAKDLGDLQSARLLYNAIRLSFRDASGPFRSIAKFNFAPRAYQMVPLIMTLRQDDPVRLFIADDVGIGKTIEALMVMRELMDRGKIKRFAVVCLPHLCDQWAEEIKNKFGLEPVIIRSGTAGQLDRKTPGDQTVYHYYPYQVISIDFIKASNRMPTFVQECPELVIVDEAHTCSVGSSKGRQQRHQLIKSIAEKPDQHLLLLSATPHSGKPHEFQSLLSLLDPRFSELDMSHATRTQRELLAKHYVQRRRADIIKWVGEKYRETTPFPDRHNYEVPYPLSSEYLRIQIDIMNLARKIANKTEEKQVRQRLNYWTALGLVRGVMSSPNMGIAMLEKRARNLRADEDLELIDTSENPVIDNDYGFEGDNTPSHLMGAVDISDSEWRTLRKIAQDLQQLKERDEDFKIKELQRLVKAWLKEGFQPIIYCRYIKTAEYVGRVLREELSRKVGIAIVTSVDADEVRQEKVESLSAYSQRVLVATDCMSEGINLQRLFTAVIHYDLPWNPNRLEQREGRVDRFGQAARTVRTALLIGENNPIDGIVAEVLLRKAREIKKAIGISVPFPENNQSIMEAVTQAVLLKGEQINDSVQLSLFDQDPQVKEAEAQVSEAYRKIEAIEKASRSIFAQHAIKAQDIEIDLLEAIRLIGNMENVENFVVQAVRHLKGQIDQLDPETKAYRLLKTGLPFSLTHLFDGEEMKISFATPTPEGYRYVARNHPLVDTLCQLLIAESMDTQSPYAVSRASVIRTDAVDEMTTVVLFRVRNVIESLATKNQIVAEELMLWGYRGEPKEEKWLEEAACMNLLLQEATAEVAPAERQEYLELALEDLNQNPDLLDQRGRGQAEKLIEAHDRFRQAVASKRYQVVEPVLPMDVMGVYVFIPNLM